ncbi:MAG: class I SAM-dependent methyltransferase [Anaerolineae bacterium]|nr:class I SAM-dependent methyltransferase [Anaerolineae bacterium]
MTGFDPDFDDTVWTDAWLHVPIAQAPPGRHPGGYRVERRTLHQAKVFDRAYRLARPFDCRLLFDPAGRLWMSSTPQEHIMMYNNGRCSQGHVLVGGLGLGLYPQYAEAVGGATRFTVIEPSEAVRAIVAPTLSAALAVPLAVQAGDIETALSGPDPARYDTIFLDTWDTLDAAHLPYINHLRDLALRRLAPGGRVLLWGYRWMVRLFEEACRQLLATPPAQRRPWLRAHAKTSPQGVALLMPVAAHFEGQAVEDPEPALDWCRRYVVQAVIR